MYLLRQILPHLRPVRVVLTPLHLRVSFCDRFLHLVLLLLLRENLHPSVCGILFAESRVGGWQVRWCMSCVLIVDLPRQPVLASEQPGFGSLAARLFQLAARIGDPVARLRGTSWLSTPARFLAPSRSFASRCESTKIDVLVRAPFSAGFLIHENAHPNVPAVLLLV